MTENTVRIPCAGSYALHDSYFAVALQSGGHHVRLCIHYHDRADLAIRCARKRIRRGYLGTTVEVKED